MGEHHYCPYPEGRVCLVLNYPFYSRRLLFLGDERLKFFMLSIILYSLVINAMKYAVD